MLLKAKEFTVLNERLVIQRARRSWHRSRRGGAFGSTIAPGLGTRDPLMCAKAAEKVWAEI